MTRHSLLVVTLALALAACGGGGGGSSSVGSVGTTGGSGGGADDAATSLAFFTPGVGGTAPANVAGTSFNCSGVCPQSTVAPSSSSGASTVTLGTNAAGESTIGLDVTGGGASLHHTFDLGVGGSKLMPLPMGSSGTATIFDVSDGPDSGGNSFDLKFGGSARSTSVLQYTTFGLWTETNADPNGAGGYGVFTAGNETTPAQMAAVPLTAIAHYSGNTIIGQGSLNGAAYQLSGPVTATAAFGGASPGVSGTITANISSPTLSGYWNTLTFTSHLVTGTSHFSGSIDAPPVTAGVSGTNGTPSITTAQMSGPLIGSFYGNPTSPGTGFPATPPEIGAVFNLQGGGNIVVGAFGAHR